MPNSVTDEIWDSLLQYQTEASEARAGELRNLAHYTNFLALKGIIERREIWFSPVSLMNDWDEIDRGKRLLEALTAEGRQLRAIVDEIRAFDEALWLEMDEEYIRRRDPDLYETFATCWTVCDIAFPPSFDDLTMWRGYAADGDGVALGTV